MPELLRQYQSTSNPNGIEPVPDSILINDGNDATYPVEAGKSYIFRIINIGAFPSFWVNIADHDFQIVEMDGVYTQPTTAKTLYIGAAMRYTILLTAKTGVNTNFDISALVDTSMFQAPFHGNPVAHGIIQYDSNQPKPSPRNPGALVPAIMPPVDDLTVPPLDNQPLLGPVTKQITLDFKFSTINGVSRYVLIIS
jgi:iron transport multicopper oxidase